ncbi:MAG: hypothetical protein V4731_00045 [Pseudomonadota bacterium]
MTHPLRLALLPVLALLLSTLALAQPAPPATAPEAKGASRPDQTVERIRTEDAGSRIDELRIGGQTRSITVQPKAEVPAYEVKPAGATRPDEAGNTGTTGPRIWNIFRF